MAVTFYYGSGSPFAWRVWLALEAKGVAYEFRRLSFDKNEHKTPDFLKLNPRGKVPVLVDGDYALYESSAILEYIAERWPEGRPLFSKDIQARATERRMLREIDEYVAQAIEDCVDFVLEGKAAEPAFAEAVAALGRELALWEQRLGGDYFAGGQPGIVDFTLYPSVALVQRVGGRLPGGLPPGLIGPKLGPWAARMKALEIVQKTWPPHWK